jgi:hypothetical protein
VKPLFERITMKLIVIIILIFTLTNCTKTQDIPFHYQELLDNQVFDIEDYTWQVNNPKSVNRIEIREKDFNFTEEGNIVSFEPEIIQFRNGEVESYETKDFDSGKKVEITYTYENGIIKRYREDGKEYLYLQKGSTIEVNNANNEVIRKYQTNMKNNGFTISTYNITNGKMELKKQIAVLLSNKGKVTTKYDVTRMNSKYVTDVCFITEYKWNEDGRINTITEYNCEGTDNKKSVETEFKKNNNKVIRRFEYFYLDMKLDKIKLEYGSDDVAIHTIEFGKFDNNNNWNYAIDKYDGEINIETERNISYNID